MIKSALILLAIAPALSAAPDTPVGSLPEKLELTFQVTVGSTRLGRLVTTLRKTGAGYEVQARTQAEGIAAVLLRGTVRETCRFHTNPQGLRPTYYERVKEGFGGATQLTQIDWQENRIQLADGKIVAIPPGYIMDNCSVPYAYMRDGLNGFQNKTVHIVGNNRIKHFELVGVRGEKLSTPLGELDTLRVEHVMKGKDRRFVVWLASAHQHVPVKIAETRKARTTTMMVEKVEGLSW